MPAMIYCLNPECPKPNNPKGNVHCQYCGVRIALRNRFKALCQIGQGGFGNIYLAKDLHNRGKYCVVKRLTYQGANEYATEKARLLFEQEAERLDQLTHPQIPRLLAYFEEGGYLYLIQELIEGQNLQAELAEAGNFDEAKIRGLLQGLLPILQFVHSRNVIHRDIKPDNIMRRSQGEQAGELVLIDFGVAKLLAQSGMAPHSLPMGTTIGTPGYAAPEQMRGRVTPASDLFALGATCFQLLTQSFGSGVNSGQLSMVGHGWVNHWQQAVQPPLSPELSDIISRLIALEETQRYPTATAVLRDLCAGQSLRKGAVPPAVSQGLFSTLPTVAVSKPPATPTPQPKPPVASPSSPPVSGKSVPVPVVQNVVSPKVALPSTVASLPPTSPSASLSATPPAQPIQKRRVGNGFWFKYGLLTFVGQNLGFLFGMVLTAALATFVGMNTDTDIPAVLNMMKLMYWMVGGFVVGLAQWIALRKWVPKAILWVPATALMFWAIALIRVTVGSPLWITGLMLGAVLALPQWWVLRRHSPRAVWWILWLAPMIATLLRILAASDYLSMVAWGLVSPVLDGVFMMWILKRQRTEAT